MIKEAIEKVKKRIDLSESEIEAVFTEIMSGKADTDTIASFLVSLKDKGECIDEITGAARIMREFATKINTGRPKLLDTCGTGGDSSGTFNISTVSAFVVAGAGCSVAKHGNRAVSSKAGSADLLEKLGVNINVEAEVAQKCIDQIGIGFLFAPTLHTAMKYAMPARRMIKSRSIFNILGPLTNPAGARYQMLGVYDDRLVDTLANVLKNLGSLSAMVVHGTDGMDEITTTGATHVAELKDNNVRSYVLNPVDMGLTLAKAKDLKGGDAEMNAGIAVSLLTGDNGPKRDIVTLNAGAAIYVMGEAESIKDGMVMAAESIDSGKALEKLERLKELTNK
ncbi:MAG: anthranilate phosphoribosyltransferase [Candidatus Omnitrophota bacterium]